MERVAFLLEETNERVACLLNPETVVLRRVAGVSSRRSIGGSLSGSQLADDALLYTGGGMTEMFLNLLFDVALAETKTEVNDVRDMTSPLWNMAENSGSAKTYGEPPRVRFVWGKSWNIPGVITSVSEHLDYFDSTGTPLRSWIRMRFLRVIEPTGEDLAKPPPPPTPNTPAVFEIGPPAPPPGPSPLTPAEDGVAAPPGPPAPPLKPPGPPDPPNPTVPAEPDISIVPEIVTLPLARIVTGVFRELRPKRMVTPDGMLMVVKLKTPLSGSSSVWLSVGLKAPSAPVEPLTKVPWA